MEVSRRMMTRHLSCTEPTTLETVSLDLRWSNSIERTSNIDFLFYSTWRLVIWKIEQLCYATCNRVVNRLRSRIAFGDCKSSQQHACLDRCHRNIVPVKELLALLCISRSSLSRIYIGEDGVFGKSNER